MTSAETPHDRATVGDDDMLPVAPGAAKAASRSLDIDRAKGLGIILVVWGHLASYSTIVGPSWFYISMVVIYSFHMPLFMYLSGFVFFLTRAPDKFWARPRRQSWQRFDRLMVPFIAFAVIIVIGKYLGQSIGPVGKPVSGLDDGLLRVLTNAPGNPALSVWYLLVLFMYSIVTPVLWRVCRERIVILVAISLIGWVIPSTDEMYIKRILVYYIFFIAGGCAAIYRDVYVTWIKKLFVPIGLLFAVSCFVMLDNPYALFVCGLLALPAIHALFLQAFWDNDRVMLTLGQYSMVIYLLNTIVIGLIKLVYPRILPYDGGWFVLFATVTCAGGLLGPMLVRKAMSGFPFARPVARYLD